jgi:glycosyltransferase involved in cell wall biosynthesis
MHIEYFTTASDQDCGISDYTDVLMYNLESVTASKTGVKLRSFDFLNYVVQSFKSGKHDVIHVQHEYGIFGPMSLASWLVFPILWFISRLRGTPIVITFHSVWSDETVSPPLKPLKQLYVTLNNAMLQAAADYEMFLSEDEKEMMGSDGVVIAHGVPTETHPNENAKDELGYEENESLVIELGYIRPEKGQKEFAAMAEFIDAKCVIAGGPQNPRGEEYLNSFDISNIEVTGVLSDDEFHDWLNAADVVVLPYKTVSQSGILSWCVAYETPLATHELEKFEEMEIEFGLPATFDRDDPESAGAVVNEVLTNEDPQIDAFEAYRAENGMSDVLEFHTELYMEIS